MGTPAQIEANRKNSKQSTGPTSVDGKAAASRNSLKHGVLSAQVLLPNEDGDAFVQLSKRLRSQMKPVGELELFLVQRITALMWRLQRLGRIEAGILGSEYYETLRARASAKVKYYESQTESKAAFRRYLKAKGELPSEPSELDRPVDEAGYQRALAEQQELEAQLPSELATSAQHAFVQASDALSNLSRYEVTIERSLYKTLHELERRQAARQGKDVPVPLAVDIDVSGIDVSADSQSDSSTRPTLVRVSGDQ